MHDCGEAHLGDLPCCIICNQICWSGLRIQTHYLCHHCENDMVRIQVEEGEGGDRYRYFSHRLRPLARSMMGVTLRERGNNRQ
ncbi:sigma factor G inhibitor Gin [Pasteuria penetrans]|uniref:sigma factor G inhibitor Gin n=1 Tax=Pasteuria penetrans TaxID=86005 RepID=UPI000F9794D7|nr:sigma factor G inhibitor Gin [Pasteuria penetrans]